MNETKPKLTVMPPPPPLTDRDEIIQLLRKRDVSDIVVVYRTPNGDVDMLTNQGTVEKTLLFMEEFKHRMMTKWVAERSKEGA